MLEIRIAAGISALILAAILLYWENFLWLYSQWATDDAYSHGFFIPLVSLYLVGKKTDFLASIPPQPFKFLGYFSICFCLILLLIGRAGAVVQIEALSFFLMIPSGILLLYGWKYLKTLFFPVLYLQFMIPWMDPILEKLHRPFQVASATIGTALLKLKYPVYSDDLYIHLPNISLVVAKECSGINFLVSVIAIGLLLVYLSQKTWSRAAIVIFIGCILTVLSNGIRVAIAGYFGQEYGHELLHGPAHIFQGWSIAWIGWIGLFIVNWFAGKVPFKNGELEYRLYERWRSKVNVYLAYKNKHSFRFHFYFLLLIFFSFASYLNYFSLSKAVSLNGTLDQFPTEVAGWQGVQRDWFSQGRYFPKLDNSLSRVYRDQSGNLVYLFVGYYEKQDNEKRLISYLSRPLHDNVEPVSISTGQSSFQVASSSFTSDGSNLATLFWYNFPAKLKFTDRMQVKLHLLKSGILHRQNNGAFVLLATPNNLGNNSNMKSIRAMQSFAASIAPLMDELFP